MPETEGSCEILTDGGRDATGEAGGGGLGGLGKAGRGATRNRPGVS